MGALPTRSQGGQLTLPERRRTQKRGFGARQCCERLATRSQRELCSLLTSRHRHAVFANVRAILEEAGSDWEKLVDITVFLVDMKRDFPTFNRIYAEYFPQQTLSDNRGNRCASDTDRHRTQMHRRNVRS